MGRVRYLFCLGLSLDRWISVLLEHVYHWIPGLAESKLTCSSSVQIHLSRDKPKKDKHMTPPTSPSIVSCSVRYGLWAGTYMGQSGHSHMVALMMGTDMVPETSPIFNQLTWLIVQEVLSLLVTMKALHHTVLEWIFGRVWTDFIWLWLGSIGGLW
jgi:hypothetical protein